MDTRLILGIIILIICCVLAFLIPYGLKKNCEKGRWNKMLDWFAGLDWYWLGVIVAAVAGLFYWFFIK